MHKFHCFAVQSRATVGYSLLLLVFSMSCKKEIPIESTLRNTSTVSPVAEIDRLNIPSIAESDPLLPDSVKGSFEPNKGKAFFAAFVDSESMLDQYQLMNSHLKTVPAVDLDEPSVKSLHTELTDRVNAGIKALSQQTDPIFKVYAPFFSVSSRGAGKNVTNLSVGFYIAHFDLGIQTVQINPHLVPLQDPNAAKDFLGKGLVWCRNRGCQAGNFFRNLPKTRITGIKGAVSLGNSTFAKGTFAINVHRGVDNFGKLGRAAFNLEAGATTMAGMASYTGFVTFEGGKPILRFPKGMNISPHSNAWIQKVFDAIISTKFGVDANPVGLNKSYYIGQKADGSFSVAKGDSFAPGSPVGFAEEVVPLDTARTPIQTNVAACN